MAIVPVVAAAAARTHACQWPVRVTLPAWRGDVSGISAADVSCSIARRAIEVGRLQADGQLQTRGFVCAGGHTRPFYPPYQTFLPRYPGYEITCLRRRSRRRMFRFRWDGLRRCLHPVSDPSSPLFDDSGGLTRYMSCAVVRRVQIAGSYAPNDFSAAGFACQTWSMGPAFGYESSCMAIAANDHPPRRAFSFGWGGEY